MARVRARVSLWTSILLPTATLLAMALAEEAGIRWG